MTSRAEQAASFLAASMAETDWQAGLEQDTFPPPLLADFRQVLDDWARGDVERMYATADPNLEIRQPREILDARAYTGREGLVEALLDWPAEWDDFRVEPSRIFALDGERVVTVARHRGRARQGGMEIDGEVVWLFRLRDGRLVAWDMFLSLDDALAAAER